MRYKVKLHRFADDEEGRRRKVKHVEADGFHFDHGGVLVFFTAQNRHFSAVAAGDWYQVSVAST